MARKKISSDESGVTGPAELEQLEIITRPSEEERIDALLDEVHHLIFLLDTMPSGSADADT